MKHITVLLEEAVNALAIKKDHIYVDATLGGGGHAKLILEQLANTGHLYAFDMDDEAIIRNQGLVDQYKNLTIIKANFKNLTSELAKLGIFKIDGILYDLGLSSFQIDDLKRGFSYLYDTSLDMRMDLSLTIDAKTILNEYQLNDLTRIFREYGEEKNAFYIAKEIIKKRPINSSKELVEITDKINYKTKGHSAKRVFQALRIEVNQELESLKESLLQAANLVNSGGKIAVITFHSLEDRIVKHFFKQLSETTIIKGLPVPIEPDSPFELITRKAILPSQTEIDLNSRSKSAKLRVVNKK
jgi:16S rRNA (cytosine1402-N4)-methyltransferase